MALEARDPSVRPPEPKEGGKNTDPALLACLQRGFKEIQESRLEDAFKSFEAAIGKDPKCVRAFYGRGLVRQRLEDVQNALADYETAILLDPNFSDAFLGRGTLQHWREDWEQAIADYTRAIQLNPKGVQGYSYRAMVWLRLQEFEKAFADCSTAIELQPANAEAYLQRGNVLKEAGKLEDALADAEKAVTLDPRNPEVYGFRGMLRQVLGDQAEAADDFQKANQLDGSSQQPMAMIKKKNLISALINEHFGSESIPNITVTERTFPFRVRADLQRAIENFLWQGVNVAHFCGVLDRYDNDGIEFSKLVVPNPHDPASAVPPQYEELDIGEEAPLRCLKNGLWLVEQGGNRFAVLLGNAQRHGMSFGIKFQIATLNNPDGTRISQAFFKHLEDSVLKSKSYRGKILSLEGGDRYSGATTGIKVHRLKTVARDEVILPRSTLELLERNVIQFVRQRERLLRYGLSVKKGILFYGPPGTGKTHTIHYLAGALPGHTTFLITAEQMGFLGEYMTLARLLQPSVVVIEDVDLIARDRSEMDGACDQVLLNKLLNEMDGLKLDAEVLFILTTNRPQSLERALASRPGRIDQAIEFPLPDEEGRAKLVRLYSRGLSVSEDVIQDTVKRTERVSASFIKELMRRSAQFRFERDEASGEVTMDDVGAALNELLFTGGSLNRALLGAEETAN